MMSLSRHENAQEACPLAPLLLGAVRHISAALALFVIAGCVADQPVSDGAKSPNILGQTVNSQRALDIGTASGFSKDAVAMMVGLKSGRQAIYLYPGTYTAKQAANAPSRVCGAQGKRPTKIEPIGPSHSGTLPGTDYLVFYCI